MHILLLYGSPRKKGLTAQMLNIMREECEKRGDTVEALFISELTVKPCLGCKVCRDKGACVLPEDDAQRVLKMLQKTDAVIIGSPCYWGNIPGQLKVLFDRLVYGLMRDTPRFPEPLMKGKKCLLVSTATTPWPFNILFNQTRGAVKALREICRYSGFKIVAAVERGGTVKEPKLTEKDRRKCLAAVKKLK